MRSLIAGVKRGDTESKHQLFRTINADARVQRALRSLLYERSIIEPDDIQAEFWRGVWMGTGNVKAEIGDPIMHLVQCGIWQVKSIVRSELQKRVVQTCVGCRHVNNRYSYDRRCERCGQSVENENRMEEFGVKDFPDDYLNKISSVTTIEITKPLTDAQLRVLEVLVQCCIDGSSFPQVDASRILGVSRERVRQHVAKIRHAVIVS